MWSLSEIINFVENETVEWRSSCKFCDGKTNYYLTAVSDTQTEFKFVTECQYKGLTKIWSWLAKSKFRKASEMYIEETFKNFKMLVEVEYTSVDTSDTLIPISCPTTIQSLYPFQALIKISKNYVHEYGFTPHI